MKIIVAVKRVVDYNVKVRVRADGLGMETANVKMSMNPFDEIAVEVAVRLKESGKATEVVAVSIGNVKCQETIRQALAMEADRGILIETDVELQPLAVAKCLKAVVKLEQPDMALLGTTFGKNLLPRVAALQDVAMLSEISGVESADTFIRPI
jgi:electron transfer flavoprotein beta subunit